MLKQLSAEDVISNSLERGLDALELLAEHGEVRLADLAEELQVSRATAFRILASLQSRGYVEHARAERVYRLGHAVRALAERSDTSSVLRLAAPAMAELRASTGETVNLALLRRGKIVYSAIFDGVHALRMQASVGAEVPAYATAIGKAVLAALPPDRRDPLLPPEPYPALTANTITTRSELTRELTAIRSRGYAVDNQEEEIGAACLAAPVLGSDGRPLGAISVSGLAARLPEEDRPEIGRMVARWCADISAQLGFRPHGEIPEEEDTA
jgi:DNA-binding IclR family transcriptional regulator